MYYIYIYSMYMYVRIIHMAAWKFDAVQIPIRYVRRATIVGGAARFPIGPVWLPLAGGRLHSILTSPAALYNTSIY